MFTVSVDEPVAKDMVPMEKAGVTSTVTVLPLEMVTVSPAIPWPGYVVLLQPLPVIVQVPDALQLPVALDVNVHAAALARITGNAASASMTIRVAAKILCQMEERDFDIIIPSRKRMMMGQPNNIVRSLPIIKITVNNTLKPCLVKKRCAYPAGFYHFQLLGLIQVLKPCQTISEALYGRFSSPPHSRIKK